jgi:hypothetical protein
MISKTTPVHVNQVESYISHVLVFNTLRVSVNSSKPRSYAVD